MYDDLRRRGSRAPAEEVAARREAIAARLERIADLERQIAGLQAQQVRETAEFIDAQLALDKEVGFSSDPAQHRAMVADVAAARHVSTISASSYLADAYELATQLPATLAALAAGQVSLGSARTIAQETVVLDRPELRRLVDVVIAEEAPDVLPGKIKALAERRVIQIDPDAAERRAPQARADKHVMFRAADPGTGHLQALLPVEQALTCWHALHNEALARYAAGDPRSVSHLMCDTLVERITGLTTATAVKTQVNLVMSDTSLLDRASTPGHLVGAGPIPAGIARLIATTGNTWLRRLYTDPVDAGVAVADSRRRRFDARLADLIRLRDQHCRGVACPSPIRDLDHIIEYSRGGRTRHSNGQGLSKGCHLIRDHPAVHVHTDPDGRAVTWQLPSGNVHRTLPPPALGPGSLNRRQVQLRHWILHPPTSKIEQAMLRYQIQLHRSTGKHT
jgi:Domain of unknown function (DUF222)